MSMFSMSLVGCCKPGEERGGEGRGGEGRGLPYKGNIGIFGPKG